MIHRQMLSLLSLAILGASAATAVVVQRPLGFTPEASSLGFPTVLSLAHIPDYSIHIKEQDPSESLCDPTVKEFSGYFETPSGFLFFQFFESRSDPETDPFVLWTNGGPGCSSNLGLYMELGPCRVAEGGNDTIPFEYSWNSNANLLFLDHPVGVGFSYPKEGHSVSDSIEDGKQVDAFFQIFFYTYPKYAVGDFHAFGESYAGHYVPAIAKAIHEGNINGVNNPYRTQVKLRSAGIGNGWVDMTTQAKYFPDFACGTKYGPFVSDEVCDKMRKDYPTCKLLGDRCDQYQTSFSCVPAELYCGNLIALPKEANRNPYDVRMYCEGNEMCYPIIGDIDAFLNRPDVQEKLGVDMEYLGCSNSVGVAFGISGDGGKSFDWIIKDLLAAGINVLIYAGDADYVCNWISCVGWMEEKLDGFMEAPEYPFISKVTGKRAGAFRTVGNLTWVNLYESGHMAPYDQPEHSLEMLNLWMKAGSSFRQG
ncbi:hypothetical protein HK101_004079 [Irineochytrium annulatum]|nr:hypothetical protein HK101_004079 [Irineochytrium annulatum]